MYARVLFAVCLLLPLHPADAHHSFAAQFDSEEPVTLMGTITSVEWTNPHIHFSIEVDDEAGVSEWRFEGFPPNMLVRQGWQRDVTLKPGDRVTVFGWRARIEPNLAAARHVTLEDGTRMVAGPPSGTGGR